MIRAFTGEFLVSPVPVHLGLNWCTHNCFYCFANLNSPERRADYASIANTLKTVIAKNKESKNLAARLLMEGHPIVASNDSDPFAKSNSDQMRSILDNFWNQGIPVTFQTRGGEGALETLERSPFKTMVYISFTNDNETIRREAEPNAPSFEQRKALALAAKTLGHHVVIGLNPYVPSWWNDFDGFARWMADNKLLHVWAGHIHISHLQAAQLSPKTKAEFAEVVELAGKKKRDTAEFDRAMSVLDQHGVNVFEHMLSSRGHFWQPYFDLGFPFFPTMDWFFSALLERGKETGEKRIAFDFEFFNQEMNPHPDFEMSEMKDYLMPFGRSIRNEGLSAKARTFREVIEWYWQIDKYPTPLRSKRIFIAMQPDEENTRWVDESGRPILGYEDRGENPDAFHLPVKGEDIYTS
ncbi:MAG: radical SAM protein [Betaproteobacteria bacterium]|nr:radical SAM protein [Betaproteobacteria bacterium]